MRRTARRLVATLILTVLLTACSVSTSVTTFASRAGGTGPDSGNSVDALTDGSAIVAGSFSGTATFGSTTFISTGGDDVFVARITPHGTWAWATRAGGMSGDSARSVSALPDGGAIVTGSFMDTAIFGGTTLTSTGFDDVFVARVNPSGTWAWATGAGNAGIDLAHSVSALADGGAVITGYFSGTITFGSATLVSTGSSDVFVARINPNGTWGWATHAGGTGSDFGYSVSALPDGSAIVTGYFNGTAGFGGANLTSTGSDDVFVARIDPAGTWAWATRAGGTGSDYGFGVSALSDGSAILAGYFSDTATFGSTTLTSIGNLDVFVARTNPNGTWAWATRAGSPGVDIVNSVSAFSDGSAIVTGSFNGTATFGDTPLTSTGLTDVFVAKIDTLGAW
jgi:hypothetical protein